MRKYSETVILSHPTGNQNVRAVIEALEKFNLLETFYTTIGIAGCPSWLTLLPRPVRKELERRSYALKKSRMHTSMNRELGRLVLKRLGESHFTKRETDPFSIDSVYRSLDFYVARKLRPSLKAVYAYEDGARESFRAAKQYGIKCLYDLPIGYWRTARELMQVEREKNPAWASTITGLINSQEKLDRKDEELALADVVYVASSFTAKTLDKCPHMHAPVAIIPYGFPPIAGKGKREYYPGTRPLRLLFVGSLTQRKGIAQLFEAVDYFKCQVSLTVIGMRVVENCEALNKSLLKHRYISSIPHQEILKEMNGHDVLVFPSIFEGFGLVISEAMSQGTPVITTSNTAGGDLIRHRENGWLITPSSTNSLIQVIDEILNDPASVEMISRAAMNTAASRPWLVYGEELVSDIKLQLFGTEQNG